VDADSVLPLGTTFGQESTTLTLSQLPAHVHPLQGGSLTGVTGGASPFDNDQLSLAVNYLIATSGIFPSRDGQGPGFATDLPTLGQIAEFAGNFAPTGWAFADGQELLISKNTALFSILGTTYGGDGVTTFALPQLSGSTLLGTGFDAGLNFDYAVGDASGQDFVTLFGAQIPRTYVASPPCLRRRSRRHGP
jgi:microcystin-dependent protein